MRQCCCVEAAAYWDKAKFQRVPVMYGALSVYEIQPLFDTFNSRIKTIKPTVHANYRCVRRVSSSSLSFGGRYRTGIKMPGVRMTKGKRL